MFDIHKIKPVHGWREFFGEVGIIVVGVLIALTAEQGVEWLHWHHKVETAQDALKVELSDTYTSAAERIIETPCLNAQLDTLKARVLGSGAVLTPADVIKTPVGPTVYRHSGRNWDDTIWQSTLSEQVSSHLQQKERIQLSYIYNSIANMRRVNNEEDAGDGSLMTLNSPLPLDPSLRGQLIGLIEAQRQRVNFMNLVATQIMQDVHELMPDLSAALRDPTWLRGMRGPSSTMSYCRTHHFPLAPVPAS